MIPEIPVNNFIEKNLDEKKPKQSLKEKIREKKRKETEKAQDIRDAMIMGEAVSTRDVNWLKKYDEALAIEVLGPVTTPAGEVQLESTEEAPVVEAPEEAAEEERFLDDAESDDELEFRDEADEGATH